MPQQGYHFRSSHYKVCGNLREKDFLSFRSKILISVQKKTAKYVKATSRVAKAEEQST